MFLVNKYTKYYYDIINHAKNRIIDGYKEEHHIIPKSLGGNNAVDNLVFLTAKEHHTVHHLLTKMVTGNKKFKMINAYWMMTISGRFKLNNIQYEQARKNHSVLVKEKWNNPNSSYNTEDYRTKIKNICIKNNSNPESLQKKFEKRAKNYIFINPEGEIFEVKGLSKFCRENGLSAGNMSSVANGKSKQSNGWKCQYARNK